MLPARVIHADLLAEGMSELAALLLNGGDIAESLCEVCDIVARVLPGNPAVRITLTHKGLVGSSSVGGNERLASTTEFVHVLQLPTDTTEDIGELALCFGTDQFDAYTRRAASLVAEHIGMLLAIAFTAARHAETSRQLAATLASRSTIDLALGILIGQYRCTREAAFGRLRDISQRRNIKVAQLSAEIVEAVSGAKPPPPHFAQSASHASKPTNLP